jgi:hypothetical protein
MRRRLLSSALVGLFGVLLLAGDARACHGHKKHCAPAPCVMPCPPPPCPPPPPPPPPPPVCVPVCAPVYVPTCAPKHGCGHHFKLFGHHKRCGSC